MTKQDLRTNCNEITRCGDDKNLAWKVGIWRNGFVGNIQYWSTWEQRIHKEVRKNAAWTSSRVHLVKH